MRLLDRYLLREFLIPLGFCLSGFLVLWIAFDLFGQLRWLQEQGLSVLEIGEYYIFKSPEFLILVLPVALLLAMLYTLTNHARYNEITAIRAAGISLTRLCVPYLVVGVVSSGLLFALDEFLVPRTVEERLRRLSCARQRHQTMELPPGIQMSEPAAHRSITPRPGCGQHPRSDHCPLRGSLWASAFFSFC